MLRQKKAMMNEGDEDETNVMTSNRVKCAPGSVVITQRTTVTPNDLSSARAGTGCRGGVCPIRFPSPYPSPRVAPMPVASRMPAIRETQSGTRVYETGFLATPTKQANYCAPAECGTARYSNCRFPSKPVAVSASTGNGCERYISPI
jgi:hypothetical protein